MFSFGRYVVVDDNKDEMRLLVEALHGDGTPCVGALYDPGAGDLKPEHFSNVRLLFLDLHLVPGQGTNPNARYSLLAGLLEGNISTTGGPYIVVLWTSHPEECAAFADYVEQKVSAAKRPLVVLQLDKNSYLGVENAGAKIRADVKARVAQNPQIQALLNWEAGVLKAAASTLAAVGSLISDDERTLAGYSAALDGVMSRLAAAAVGKPNVDRDPRAAVSAALIPVLQDSLLNASATGDTLDLWKAAVTKVKNLPDMSNEQVGAMNRALHLSLPANEAISADDWGAVLKPSLAASSGDQMQQLFGMKLSTLLNDIFLIDKADREKCLPCVIRIGAVCDYAQRKPGPILYVMGLLVPVEVTRRNAVVSKAEFEGPLLLTVEDFPVAKLFVNARFQISFAKSPEGWDPIFRIREGLLVALAAHCAEYITRPGFIKLPL
ncbi:MAG: hypothetical protein JWM58_3816 [Rhizobium sp.]|nr:hypothetical protein [Rhizobium sp.]